MFNKRYVMWLSDKTAHLERKRGLILVLFGCERASLAHIMRRHLCHLSWSLNEINCPPGLIALLWKTYGEEMGRFMEQSCSKTC